MQNTISATELTNTILELFKTCEVEENQSESVARNMVWSELVGRNNFGVIRIPVHVKRLEKGVLNGKCKPKFTRTSSGTGLLEADNGFGYFSGEIAMDEAINLASENGIGMVGVNNSNFFGTGAYFVNRAAENGMLGIAFSNSFPKVVAHGGLAAVLGTNPFAFGAPRKNGHHLLVDFATSSLAGSTVREYREKGEDLPEGLAIMPDGSPVTDPTKIGEAALLPFGGAKGYGISLMVEVLSGLLTGSGFSHSVKSTYSNFQEKSDSGHAMIAIDVTKFMPLDTFHERFEALVNLLRASGNDGDILLPGEIRWQQHTRNSINGLIIPLNVATELNEISIKYGLEPAWGETV